MIRALVTNDDGIDSPGLVALAAAAASAGLDVTVAAPSWDSSGASSSLTGVREDGRLRTERRRLSELDVPVFAVDAAPAMIALVALRGAFGEAPEIVLSGINCGRNTGRAVLHSGTVGAVFTAVNHGASGIAVSIDSAAPQHWDTAAELTKPLLAWLIDHRPTSTLNLNVPDLPMLEVRGMRQAHLAAVGAVQTNVTDAGGGYVQVTVSALETEPDPGSDAALLAQGWAVVSALDAIRADPDLDLSQAIAGAPPPNDGT